MIGFTYCDLLHIPILPILKESYHANQYAVLIKGPSKNYVTARGGGVTDFVTYRYVYFEGGERYSMT